MELGWEWGVGPGWAPQAGKQLASFTGHIIFYGHPKKNVRHWRASPPPLPLSLSPLITAVATAGLLSQAWSQELGGRTGTS